ncbi:MAG TPA: hypothetical protein P5098_02080 [Candidatus Dojkabacteria bacterium]|nr:hypothetical protein [Candidatus Dojkabacteria bacterium]
MKTKICKNCKSIFEVYPSSEQEFCSKTCYVLFHNVTVKCKNCGKEMQVYKSRLKKIKYCSKTCSKEYLNKTKNERSKRMSELKKQLFIDNPEMRIKAGNGMRGKTSHRKGLSYEEEYGKEKAIEIKRKVGWGTIKRFKKTGNEKKEKTYEEIYGNERASEIKNKLKENWRKSGPRKAFGCYGVSVYEEMFACMFPKYERQKCFRVGKSNFKCDFYDPITKTAYEIDGNSHLIERRKKLDIIKEKYLNTLGIKVVHIDNDTVEEGYWEWRQT